MAAFVNLFSLVAFIYQSAVCGLVCACTRVCKVRKCKLPEFLQVIEDGNVGENAGY